MQTTYATDQSSRSLHPPAYHGSHKRSNVTSVACEPCQRRKQKCDGKRPVCSRCLGRTRHECIYDAGADQRRTTALKGQIQELQQRCDELKDIICSIGAAPNAGAAIAVAHHLAANNFQAVPEAAHALRAAQARSGTTNL
ncbi:hypothetical protein B0J12DRAFT_162812 [Macrophomina phaseolina]|uniref:Zn(2)-C6 fungal-type domain-containing protein n=1 Tax=Macrophomina phaseolina TaxID=35725 RepID=A0ABQ8GRW8_9PEZI|nr:hypothetical protein B0J12DRAFT_162812 [Macrophomina phaseolina]